MMILDKFSFKIFRCKHDKNAIAEESLINFGAVCEMCIILSYLLIQFSQTWVYCAKWNHKIGPSGQFGVENRRFSYFKNRHFAEWQNWLLQSPLHQLECIPCGHTEHTAYCTRTQTQTHTHQNAAVHCKGVKKGSIWKENSEKLKQDQRKKIERVTKKDSEHLWPACEWSILGLMRQKGHKDVVNASSSIQNLK